MLQLLKEGRTVIAASRDAERAKEVLPAPTEGPGKLTIEGGIDITNEATLKEGKLWQGVSQVAIAVGPVFGRQEGGGMG